jgi:hypothetical protein
MTARCSWCGFVREIHRDGLCLHCWAELHGFRWGDWA